MGSARSWGRSFPRLAGGRARLDRHRVVIETGVVLQRHWTALIEASNIGVRRIGRTWRERRGIGAGDNNEREGGGGRRKGATELHGSRIRVTSVRDEKMRKRESE